MILYIADITIKPFISGGGQERNMRHYWNVYGIAGLSKAMDVSYRDLEEHRAHIEMLKQHMIKAQRCYSWC